jgi:hypothetical protein
MDVNGSLCVSKAKAAPACLVRHDQGSTRPGLFAGNAAAGGLLTASCAAHPRMRMCID